MGSTCHCAKVSQCTQADMEECHTMHVPAGSALSNNDDLNAYLPSSPSQIVYRLLLIWKGYTKLESPYLVYHVYSVPSWLYNRISVPSKGPTLTCTIHCDMWLSYEEHRYTVAVWNPLYRTYNFQAIANRANDGASDFIQTFFKTIRNASVVFGSILAKEQPVSSCTVPADNIHQDNSTQPTLSTHKHFRRLI